MDDVRRICRSRTRFALVALGALIAGIAGYVGFINFEGTDRSGGTALLALAAATGFAAFFSPCSFPLLLTFLSRRAAGSSGASLVAASRVALGATTLLAVLATVIWFFGDAAANTLAFDQAAGRVFRLVVGMFLVVLGLRQARVIGIRINAFDRIASVATHMFDSTRRSTRFAADVTYGFGYLLAGFG